MATLSLILDSSHGPHRHFAAGLAEYAPPEYHVAAYDERSFTFDAASDSDALLWLNWPSWTGAIQHERAWALVDDESFMVPWQPPTADNSFASRIVTKTANRATAKQILGQFHGVVTTSGRLHRQLVIQNFHQNVKLLRSGVDTDTFSPRRRIATDNKLRVGWCGVASDDRSCWTPAGFWEIAAPAMNRFARRGAAKPTFFLKKLAARNWPSPVDMAAWLNEIDVLLATAVVGGPEIDSLILEAMACGRTVITSEAAGVVRELDRVGRESEGAVHSLITVLLAPQVVDDCPAVIDAAERVLRWMMANREWAVTAGAAAREAVEKWFSWRVLAEEWCRVLCEE